MAEHQVILKKQKNELFRIIEQVGLEPGNFDIPFSHAEAEQIASALMQVEEKIIEEFKPTPQQVEFIQSKRSYLESKAKEGYPRIDWVNILVGVMTSIAVALSLSPEQAHRLRAFYKEALLHPNPNQPVTFQNP